MKLITRSASAILAAALLTATAGLTASSAEGRSGLAASLPIYELTTLAGGTSAGLTDGEAAAASFRWPQSIAVKPDGTLLVTDTGNQRIRAIIDGTVSTASGNDIGIDEFGRRIGSYVDGIGTGSAFQGPAGIAAGTDGRAVIADSLNHAIRILDAAGRVDTVAGTGVLGHRDGAVSQAQFYQPLDATVDEDGVIYVADTLNHVIRKIEHGQVSTLTAVSKRIVEYHPGAVSAAGGYADGPIAQSKFNEPSGLALDSKGNLYVSDTGNNRIRYIDFAKGTVTTVAGKKSVHYTEGGMYDEGGYRDGAAAEAEFRAPLGIAVTPDGGLLIADSLNHIVRYLIDGTVRTAAGSAGEAGRLNGPALYGKLHTPADVAWLGGGRFAIADQGNSMIRLAMPYTYPAGLKNDGRTKVVYGQEILASGSEPLIVSGVTFVPVRLIGQRLGYSVGYDQASKRVRLELAGAVYLLENGTKTVERLSDEGAQSIRLSQTSFIKDGKMYLPVRFFAEQAGLDVQWLGDVKAVLLRDKQAD